MSATSTTGLLISSYGDTRGWFLSRWKPAVGPAGFEPRVDAVVRGEDTLRLSQDLHGRAESESCADPFLLRVSGVAQLCRSVCGVTRLRRPACCAACVQAYHTLRSDIGWSLPRWPSSLENR